MSEYDQESELLEAEQSAPREDRPVPCEFVCGVAGSGKTFLMKKAVQEDSSYGVLSATTGIASVNLGTTTVHSLLRYSTTEVLKDSWLQGKLVRILHALGKRVRRLIIDECSMASAHQLDIIHRAVREANRFNDMEEPLGITLVGDFLQLAPVKEPWVFTAECWPEFAANTTKLTKVWRQDNAEFLAALNLVRAGKGGEGASVLSSLGAQWNTSLDTEFDGTTILPRNDMVSRFNQMALERVKGEEFTVTSRRWGSQQSEWGQSQRTKEWGIPPSVRLKVGSYVMILSNASDFHFVNGDCGHIEGHDDDSISIRLIRTGNVIELPRVVRGVEYSERPDAYSGSLSIPKAEDEGAYIPRQHFRGRVRRYVMGQIEMFPLRLAYASTVHKTQSLTLDRVQVDYRDHFFSHPGMCYVSLSRCRTLGGLRLVGQRETFASRCTVDPKVREWV
jgi:hypothetical protein